MDSYPIHLNLKQKKITVIGGGKIAERKVMGLIDTGAQITVISPEITDQLQDYVKSGSIDWQKKTFCPSDIQDSFLIIAATNQRDINMKVKEPASPSQLISLVDNLEASNFISPSVLKRGKLMMTVSTSGASPTLAKKIKHELEEIYGLEYEEYVDFLFHCRKWILEKVENPKAKQALLAAIIEPRFLMSLDRKQDFSKLYTEVMNDDGIIR
jgi:precorrin-2 dehydrogenase / sirohydrochlorin ferrochelatase